VDCIAVVGRPLLLSLAVALLGTGCFAAPWALPPARVTLGGGASSRSAAASAARHRQGDGVLSLRASVEPLQLVGEAMDRPLDFGVGYELETGPAGSVYGPFGEVGWVLYASPTGRDRSAPRGWGRLRPFGRGSGCTSDGGCFRAAVRTRLASLRSDEVTGGWLVGTQFSIETSSFVSSSFGGASGNGRAGAAAGGVAYGETGIGLYVDASHGTLAGQTWWSLTGGLVVRLPISVGGFFVACPECMAATLRL